MNRNKNKTIRGASLVLAMTMGVFALLPSALAQQSDEWITPNFVETDIREIVDAVNEITGQTFIIDPRVTNAKVTMISSTPMGPDAFYEAFLSILDVHQLAAMTTGDITKIIPVATARQYAGPLGARSSYAPVRLNSFPSCVRSCRSTAISWRIRARTCSSSRTVPRTWPGW